MEAPSGHPTLLHQFDWTEDEVVGRCVEAVSYAKEKGLFVNFFPYDTSRARLPFLKRLVNEVAEKGKPDSLAVIDTTGCILPSAMKYLVEEMRATVDLPIEVHTHNDLGLGIANALAAVEAGAEVVHTCVNGLGERCGNAALDEVAVCLRALLGLEVGVRFERLFELSKLVERCSGIPLAVNKPLTGEVCFTRESGLGIEVLLREPRVGFSIHPSFVGREFRVVLGKKSGRGSVEMKLKELGLEASEEQVKVILERVKESGIEKKACLAEQEFEGIAASVLSSEGQS